MFCELMFYAIIQTWFWLDMAVSLHSWRNKLFLGMNQQPSVSKWPFTLCIFFKYHIWYTLKCYLYTNVFTDLNYYSCFSVQMWSIGKQTQNALEACFSTINLPISWTYIKAPLNFPNAQFVMITKMIVIKDVCSIANIIPINPLVTVF